MDWANRGQSLKPLTLAIASIVTFLAACHSPQTHHVSAGKVGVRNNAASLLYSLLGDEQNVDKLLLIKRERRELHEVIKNIASTSGTVRKRLEKLAAEDTTLDLKTTSLPPGEMATRESESKARAKELLQASGAELEFKLLLTQAEALAYATHLAKVAAENEPLPERAKVFAEISQQLESRHRDVLSLLSGLHGSRVAQ